MTSTADSQLSWEIQRIDLSDFLNIDAIELRHRFRSDRPKLLIYSLSKLSWSGIVRVSPVDNALCALADIYPAVFKAQYKWTSSVVDDLAVYKNFCADLKAAGLSRHTIPWELFGNYVQWGAYAGSDRRGFCRDAPFMGLHRVSSFLVPNGCIDAVVDYHQSQLEQFASHSFVPAPEGQDRGGGYGSGDDEKTRILQHIHRMRLPDETSLRSALEDICGSLRGALDRIDSGLTFEWDVHYKHIARPPAQFRLMDFEPSDKNKDLEQEIFLLRAKLVRQLAWPQLYGTVHAQLKALDDFSQTAAPESREFIDQLSDELQGFLSVVEDRYPVILANPLEEIA